MDNNQTNQKKSQPENKININEINYDFFDSKDGNISISFADDLAKMEYKSNCKTEPGNVNSSKKVTKESSNISSDSKDKEKKSLPKKNKKEKNKDKNDECIKDSLEINLKES